MTKTEIICDTNIWYNLGNNIFELPDLKNNVILYATYFNFEEFAITPRRINNFDYWKNGANQLLETAKNNLIINDPFCYFGENLGIIDKFHKKEEIEQYKIFLDEQVKLDNNSENDKSLYLELLKDKKKVKQDIINFLNEEANKIKSNIVNLDKHRENTDSKILVRKFIEVLFNNNRNLIGKLPNKLNFTQIELFENILHFYFIELETGERVATENDIYDLLLLIYVTPQRKLWTMDKKLLTRIIEKNGFGKYLYKSLTT